ncbi:synaptonemal complex protein 2-like isoform X1 [Leucoraja erinacea]|uniref:synaptonemal complex protein 2-like isoform X1 n=1 Tax=Leucoraja erinaceus TaxID=7782 RepID=UPI00245447B1|nr:synaptonemal complex protein 2-like isoform X1 [Leucoraja erinacea]
MFSAIAANYTDETKGKYLNKDKPLSIRYQLDQLHHQKQQKQKLENEKRTWIGQKGVACTANLKNKMEDSTHDVYSFDGSSTTEPTISLGVKYKTILQQTWSNKRKPEKKNMKRGQKNKEEMHKSMGNVNKKHFFTDTDTDGKTEVSWIKESNKKTKPKLVAYSRQRKQSMADNLSKVITSVGGHCGKKSKDKKKPIENINSIEVPVEKRQRNCPRRTAAAQPRYKEVSESESDTCEESLSSPHQRDWDVIMPVPTKKICRNSKKKANMSADYEQENQILEVSTVQSYENTSVEKIRYERMCKSAALTRFSSPLESEGSIRSENSSESLQSPNLSTIVTKSCKSTRSILKTATPLSSPVYSAAKATFTSDFSPVVSPISLVTPLCLEINEKDVVHQESVKLKNADEEIIANKSISSENSIVTTRSSNNFTLSSISGKKTTAEETHSRSVILEKSRRVEKDRVPSSEVYSSGPTHSSVLKSIYGKNLQSNFDDDEEEEGTTEQRTRLKPRKLFTCDFGNQNCNRADSELLSTVNRGSSIKQMDYWGQSEPNMGEICQQFSKELKVKFQKHSQRIDSYTKFSLKSAQQRMSSTNIQINCYRLKRLDKFQAIVMQELQHFEKDSQSLKCMEKELSNLWKQHSKTFSELKENEEDRIQHLRSSFENNVCHSVEFEERIFNTEMHLMRKDMKIVQDRLLKEMASIVLSVYPVFLQTFE